MWKDTDFYTDQHKPFGTTKFRFLDDVLQQPAELSDDMELYKLGRTTRWTEGRYNELVSVQLPTGESSDYKRQVNTKGHSVMGGQGPFSLEGD